MLKEAIRLSKLGYSVIPIDKNKIPIMGYWRHLVDRPMTESECTQNFKNSYGIALLMGGRKKLTCIDFDTKYFIDEIIKYEDIKKSIPKEILAKMRVQRTVSGGFHWLFSCDIYEGNKKLANRKTTDIEVYNSFMEEYIKSKDINKSMKFASNDKCKVLIETRGHGGYICIDPTPGYKWIYGDKIRQISSEEYEILMTILRSFNSYTVENKNLSLAKVDSGEVDSPFLDFNKRGDGLQILLDNGWTIQEGSKNKKDVRLLRPGTTHSASSAMYDTELKLFNVFSTSTSFEVGKGYSNTDLYMELEGISAKDLYIKLKNLGYGK